MVGFIVPIDEVENIKEFLLVRSLVGHMPNIHRCVRVVVPDPIKKHRPEAIRVEGRFFVSATVEASFVVDVYQLRDAKVTAWK